MHNFTTAARLRRKTQRGAISLRSDARVQHWQGDVAEDRNGTIIEPGDGRTADDESDGKPYIVWKKGQSSIRPHGREKKRPHVPKKVDDLRVQPDLFGDRI